MQTSQQELLFQKILHLRETLVGFLAFLIVAKRIWVRLADFPAVFFYLCHGAQLKTQVQIS